MSLFLKIIILIGFICSQSDIDPRIVHFRSLLSASRTSSETAQTFISETEKITASESPTLNGFKAMAQLVYCDHAGNVYSKYNYFKKGKLLLEAAIKSDPANVELIFFRFTTQNNAPDFLGYNANLKNDKLILVSYLKNYNKRINPDAQLFAMVKSYLLSSKACDKTEKAEIKGL